MERLECIKDDGYDIVHCMYIERYPVKGEVYEVRGRVHGPNGVGVLLVGIENPLMPNGVEPNFSRRRFREVGDKVGSVAAVKLAAVE